MAHLGAPPPSTPVKTVVFYLYILPAPFWSLCHHGQNSQMGWNRVPPSLVIQGDWPPPGPHPQPVGMPDAGGQFPPTP